MRRIVLFSMPTETNIERIFEVLFPKQIENKVLAYLPTNGSQTKQIYTDYWTKVAGKNNAKFTFVDNTLPELSEEAKKVGAANILLITGGNTYELLHNLRQSKLDQAIKAFTEKKEFVLGGFSAGAIVLSPNINTANVPSGVDPTDLVDENVVGITNLSGLNIVDFEIIPHYDGNTDKHAVEKYRKTTKNEVREITNEGVIVLNL